MTLTNVCDYGVETDGNKPGGLRRCHDLATLANLFVVHAFAFSGMIVADIFVCFYWFQMLNKVRSLSHKMR